MIEQLYDKFKPWSEGGSVYILSDTHFKDDDMRPPNIDWMDPDVHLALINSIVKKGDTFICLGDVGDPEYAKKINAKYKVLITGNHDDKPRIFKEIFDEIYTGPLFIGEKILLSHEPVRNLSWCLNIHGHVHKQHKFFADEGHYLNLASDMCGFKPVNLKQLIKNGALSKIKTIHRETIDFAGNKETNNG